MQNDDPYVRFALYNSKKESLTFTTTELRLLIKKPTNFAAKENEIDTHHPR